MEEKYIFMEDKVTCVS